MDRIIWIAIFVTILFVLTYDPKSRTLEKYIPVVHKPEEKKRLSGGVNDFRATEDIRYQSLQFGELNSQYPRQVPQTVDGVIVA